MSITKGITDRTLCWYCLESTGVVHFPIALLIIVNFTEEITDGLKSRRCYLTGF
jgi:hypothetical protein